MYNIRIYVYSDFACIFETIKYYYFNQPLVYTSVFTIMIYKINLNCKRFFIFIKTLCKKIFNNIREHK